MKRRYTRGSALVEFAFAVAILTPVFAGAWQFFAAYSAVEAIQQSALGGARAAAVLPYDSPDQTPTPVYRRAVEDAVLAAAPAGLRREHIRVSMYFENGRPHEVEVSITGLQLSAPGGAIALTGQPRARFPYRGEWLPR